MSTSPSHAGAGRRLRFRWLCAALAAGAGFVGTPGTPGTPAAAWADTLHLRDGRTLEGAVVAEDAASITLEMHLHGAVLRQRLPRAQVARIERVAREGPGYYPLPIVGHIGVDTTAAAFADAVREVRASGATYVVLVIDSPGGLVHEMEAIARTIADNRDLQFIAWVRQAYSAAAIVALACPRIYIAPGGAIGAAVPMRFGPDGTPAAIEEKHQSAIRASLRNIAAAADRSPLWARGMAEMDLELVVVEQDGRKTLVEPGPGVKGLQIKAKGQILTVTAQEAVAFGLAEAVVATPQEIHASLELPAWHRSGDLAWDRMLNAAKAEQQRGDAAASTLAAERERAMETLPELLEVREQVIALGERLAVLERSRQVTEEAWRHARADAEADYAGRSRSRHQAEAYEAKIAALRRQYAPRIETIDREIRDLKAEGDRLAARAESLIKAMPGAQ